MTVQLVRSGGDVVADSLAAVSDILSGISGTQLWSAPDGQVTELLATVARVANQVAALQLRLVAEVHGRDLGRRAGAASTAAWLRHTVNLSPAEARRQTTLAAALAGGLERTRDALTDGRVSMAQASVIAHAVAELPDEVKPATRREAEEFLVDQAARFDPISLARLGRRILDVVDPDAGDVEEARRLAAEEKRAQLRRELRFTPDGHGTVWLRGRLDTESAAIVRRALDPLARPRPSDAGQPDARSAGARTADALVELCRRALSNGNLPTQRSERPQIVITMDLDKLRARVGAGDLDTGERLSPGTVRRLACDADVIPAVLGSGSVPLDLGRTVRLFTAAQRRALILRDKGCAFPGCDRPPAWCESHHIHHWIDGGKSHLDNGVLLCGIHHREIHKGLWQVTIAEDGHPEIIPPDYVSFERKPMRNRVPRRLRE